MSYATRTDLEKVLPEAELISLTDDNETGAVDETIVDGALETATVTIDSYLANRYQLPLASPPLILTKLCVDIAAQLLYIRHGSVPEDRLKQHDNAISFLEKIGTGKLSLGAGDPEGSGNSETFQVSAPEAIFSSDELDKF